MMAMEIPRLGLASFRRRILLRAVFLLLALATLALAAVLLRDEKERSYRNYQQAFGKTQAEVMARLRQPAGVLALLNPQPGGAATPLRPVVLPHPTVEFDDQNKVQQAFEQAGCAVRYPDGSQLCAAVGGSRYAGGFLYLVGSFRAGSLELHEGDSLDIEAVHRARIALDLGGQALSWVAPFERQSMRGEPLVRARMSGFETTGDSTLASARPARGFIGWLWQSAACSADGELPYCLRRVFYAMRLPVQALREGVGSATRVHLQMLPPGDGPPVFDSDAGGAQAPATLDDLATLLRPGEVLTIARQDIAQPPVVLKGREPQGDRSSPLVVRVIDLLPVVSPVAPVEARETLVTPAGSYEVRLAGDVRGIDAGLSVTATRMSWYVGAMLAAIVLAWLLIEVGLIRRITVLTRRAAAVSHNVQQQDARGAERIGELDVSDLRGTDELGILAGGLADLLQRVKDDVQREQLRAQQERDMLQAVGHEILSPLQSLMALHPAASDPARRYVQRMQQAVRVLYGQASPSEALQAAQLDLAPLDLDRFLQQVAANAQFAGIEDVRYEPRQAAVTVRADEFSLEDVMTHILRNADRHRTPHTPITLSLQTDGTQATVCIHNEGPEVEAALLGRIFDYGVSEAEPEGSSGRRGQGLFVARTYMAKMGGTVSARNEAGGVAFYLVFPRG